MVEDILSESDPVAEQQTLGVAPGLPKGLSALEPMEKSALEQADHGLADRRWLFASIAVILLGIAILGFGIRWFLGLRPQSAPVPSPTILLHPQAPSPEVEPQSVAEPAPGVEPSTPAPLPEPASPPVITPLDSDRDGLPDAQETERGTDVLLPDTDGDGLTDYDEVSVFGTDPKNSDTDTDGYRDGDEVASGYNPKGAGKLLDLQGALNKK